VTSSSDRSERPLSRALTLLAPTVAIVVAAEFIVVGLLPVVAQDLSIPLARAGGMAGWFAFSAAVAGPIVTLSARRLTPRFILTGTLLLYAACNLLVATVSDFSLMLLARMVQGATLPAFISVGASVVMELAPMAERGNGLSRANIGFVLGVLLALPAGFALARCGTWRLPFVVLAATSMLLAPLIAMRFPSIPAGRNEGLGGPLAIVRQPVFVAHLGLSVVLFAAMFSAYTYLGAWVEQALGLSTWGVAVALLLFGLFGLLGNSIAGRVADIAPMRATMVAVVVLVASVNLTALAGHAILLAAAPLVLWSASHTASVALGQVRVTLAGQSAASFAMTLNISAANLGIAIGAAGGGRVIDSQGISAIGIAPFGFAILSLPIVSFIRRSTSRGISRLPLTGA